MLFQIVQEEVVIWCFHQTSASSSDQLLAKRRRHRKDWLVSHRTMWSIRKTTQGSRHFSSEIDAIRVSDRCWFFVPSRSLIVQMNKPPDTLQLFIIRRLDFLLQRTDGFLNGSVLASFHFSSQHRRFVRSGPALDSSYRRNNGKTSTINTVKNTY